MQLKVRFCPHFYDFFFRFASAVLLFEKGDAKRWDKVLREGVGGRNTADTLYLISRIKILVTY